LGQVDAPVLLLHNKVLELDRQPAAPNGAPPPTPGEPWVIGWFGALRCRKSLEMLAAFTRQAQGRFEVVLRGRPAYSECADFEGFVAAEPHVRFEGAYRNPQDLAAIYGEVHFAWAVDFFEEGLNSSWLLPNRLYEGCLHGAIPIAMADTETGRFLAERQIGLRLDKASPDALATLLGNIDADGFAALRGGVTAQDRGTWVFDRQDCLALVERLRGLSTRREPAALLEAA